MILTLFFSSIFRTCVTTEQMIPTRWISEEGQCIQKIVCWSILKVTESSSSFWSPSFLFSILLFSFFAFVNLFLCRWRCSKTPRPRAPGWSFVQNSKSYGWRQNVGTYADMPIRDYQWKACTVSGRRIQCGRIAQGHAILEKPFERAQEHHWYRGLRCIVGCILLVLFD